MKFANEIQLSLPADDVFAALTDIERVASCLPGARVQGREGRR
jgi:carbon monoxide dehydrogenase subunit G